MVSGEKKVNTVVLGHIQGPGPLIFNLGRLQPSSTTQTFVVGIDPSGLDMGNSYFYHCKMVKNPQTQRQTAAVRRHKFKFDRMHFKASGQNTRQVKMHGTVGKEFDDGQQVAATIDIPFQSTDQFMVKATKDQHLL